MQIIITITDTNIAIIIFTTNNNDITIITITTTIPVVLLESIDERLNTDPPTVDVLIIFSDL